MPKISDIPISFSREEWDWIKGCIRAIKSSAKITSAYNTLQIIEDKIERKIDSFI